MLWIPPPHWMVAFAVALLAHIAIIVIVFVRRGWKRGLLAVPVGFVLFVASVVGGSLLSGALWQLDMFPLVTVLAAAAYGTYALMMWQRRPPPPKT